MSVEMRTCPHCTAYYRVSDDWVYGRYSPGTSGRFSVYGKIPSNKCPMCRKEHTDEVKPKYRSTM